MDPTTVKLWSDSQGPKPRAHRWVVALERPWMMAIKRSNGYYMSEAVSD